VDPANLNELRALWLAHKQAEKAAQTERLAVEEAIVALLPSGKEGTVTDKATGISVAYKNTRKVDNDALQGAWMSLNTNQQNAFKWKADIDTRHLKGLQELDPGAYQTIAAFITSTPAKPSISIKEL
jgi:hypothetical protein